MGTPGCLTKIQKSNDPSAAKDDDHKFDYEDYRSIAFKWQLRICKVFMSILQSKNYVQIRNAMIVLTKVVNVPVLVDRVESSRAQLFQYRSRTRRSKFICGRHTVCLVLETYTEA